jgi:hypothetical protein
MNLGPQKGFFEKKQGVFICFFSTKQFIEMSPIFHFSIQTTKNQLFNFLSFTGI